MTDVATLVRAHLGKSIARSDRVHDGNQKETYRAVLEDGRTVFVQLGDAGIRHEIALHRDLVARSVLPVPTVLAAGRTDERALFITEAIPGGRLTDALPELDHDERTAVCRTLGRYLARLHAAYAFGGHGYVIAADGDLVVDRPRSARSAVTDLLDRGLAALPPALADLRRPVRSAVARSAIPVDAAARLYPWDFRPGNMRWHDGDVTVLDWGTPMAAPAVVGVAKAMYVSLDWFDLTAYRPAFLAGYRSVRRLTADPAYWRVASVLAVVRSAVDGRGAVTRPYHPMADESTAIAFHRSHLERLLGDPPEGPNGLTRADPTGAA